MTKSKMRLNSTRANSKTIPTTKDTYRLLLFIVVMGALINVSNYFVPVLISLSPMLTSGLVHILPLIFVPLLLMKRKIYGHFRAVRFVIPVLLFMALVALFHQDAFLSLRRVTILGIRFVIFIALYAGFCQLTPNKRLWIIAMGCFIVVIFGFVTIKLGIFLLFNPIGDYYSIKDIGYVGFENIWAMGVVPRPSAGYIGGMLVLVTYFLFIDKRDQSIKLVKRIGLVVMGIMGLIAVIYAGVRTVLIGIGGVMLVSALYSLNSAVSSGKFLRFLLRIFMILCILGVAYQVTEIIISKEAIQVRWVRPGSSIDERLEIWESAIDNVLERPLVGWGPTNVQYKLTGFSRRNIPNAHNEILTILAEWGIVVTGFLIFLFYRMVKNSQVFKYKWKIALLSYFLIIGFFWPLAIQYHGVEAFLSGVMLAAISATNLKQEN